MKKLIFGAAVLASAFFAASCQQEMLDPQAEGTTVTYTVEVPDAIATKAIGDGFRLHYEVYRQDYMNETAPVYEGTREFSAGKATVELEFVKDQEFYVLFWAQQINGAQAYNIGDLRNVSLNTLVANDLTAEVFAGNDHVSDCKSDKNGNVVLVRPVAQLNIATTADSFTLGTEGSNTATVVPTTSEVVVNGLYDTYNVATGTTGTKASRTYTEYAVPGSDFKGTAYKLMATNYLGFIPQAGDNVEVTFTIKTTTEAEPIVHTVSNVPVKANYQTNILGNLISAIDNYQVTLEDWADGEITHPLDGASLQTALDNAVPGTTIQLEPGVNYGTLYLRPSANADVTKVVDWVGNNYRYETYSLFQDITIKGAEGATVDAIEIEGGTYYNTPHSQSSKYPIMLSLIELKNVVIDGVTFTGKGGYDPQGHGNAINLSGNNIKVDGLTIQNCTLNNPENNARLIYKTESTTTEHKYTYDDQTKALQEYTFTPSLKNIKVTGTTFNGGYIGLELRETENVTITNNTFNVADRNILLPVNSGCTYSGKVTITDNVSNNAKQRFVRMSGAGDAEVVIKNNTINNYQGADADYIKVTDGTNVTIENNVLGASTSAELVAALKTAVAAGETNIVFDAKGANIGNFNKDDNTWFTTNLVPTGVTVTLRNATVSGISRWNNANGTLIFENCTFTNNSAYSINFGWGNGHVKFTNCKLYGWCSFSGVTVEMNDCNIAGNGSYALVRSYNTFTMNNCTIDGSNAIKDDDYPDGVSIGDGAVLTMTGCTMTDAEYDYGESLIDGKRVVDYGENSSYIIVDGKRLVCNPSSLEYALKNGNAILMENNITVEAHLTNTSHGTNINIDGGGNELTLRGIYGVSGANVSLSNMTLVDSKTDDYTIFNQGGKIELNNVTYNSTINKAFQMAGGGDVVLTDCNISGDVTGTYSASNIWCGDGRNVTVNGGTYGSIFMNAQYHSGWPAASAHAASKITLNDGTITKLILETELGAEGYYVSATLTQNGGTITNLVENPQNLDLTGRSQYNK